jgi:hypothetical protein
LIKAKTRFLADELKKQTDKLRKHQRLLSPNRVKYMKLEPIGELSDSEEEVS